MINNFEILIRCYEKPVPEEPKEAFKFGKITFYKLPSSVENDKRREILERNFDKRDDWSNVKSHCHALNEHEEGPMVYQSLELIINIILHTHFIRTLSH